MITQNIIDEVKQRLVKTYTPLEIYLFGSYAWGTPTKDSDLDVLVVVENTPEKRHALLVKGYQSLRDLVIPKDIIVFTKNEFDQHTQDAASLCHKIKREGVRLYAKA